ncbi:transposase [Teredinibacter turnerae]|uniref:Transposase, OrfA n=2 Tax=Teredinibacter turnerae TaxID=2426 RepID=C5BJG8_TERTT|nr:transposase [Teredinibacter turnerae]ACR11781.1 transposase, OrfA [Teredinibacter turnerae T7901]
MARRKHYNSYDDDFKATAVALTEIPGVQANHVAEALDIHEVMLYRWRMEMRRGQIRVKKKNIQIDPDIKSELKRLRKLEREHNLLQEEHALLKKAIQHSLQKKEKSSNSST